MSVRPLALLALLTFLGSPALGYAQATKPPAPKTPTAKPAPKPVAKPAAKPAPKPAAAPAVETLVAAPVVEPVPVVPADLHFKTRYTTGDQVTESTTYIQANRERYEMADMILLKQHDQNRTVQISRASNVYLVAPEGLPPASAAPGSVGAAPKAPGVVMMATSIVDTGERKTTFGREARHVKTMVDRQPQPGACDESKLRIETDAWYIDVPKAMATPVANDAPSAAGTACADEIRTTSNGDPNVLGFPISYTTTFIEVDNKDSKPVVVAMEVIEFEVTSLDAGLFEIPQGMTAAMNAGELSKAVSNANEAKLASGAPVPGSADKKPGVMRVGVPEVANKTTQSVDTRALRTRLIAELEEQKIEAIPMAAASPADLETRATGLGVDYLLMAEITELKASKPGGITRMMKATAGEGGAPDITEAKMTVQLVPPGGKPRLSTATSGKDGGIGLKTGLGLAKFAGTMYLKMYMGGGMYGSPMGAMNTMQMMNMGGMGPLSNPALMEMQTGMGGMRMGVGADRTAGAATYIMNQAMMGAASAKSQGGPSFEAALDDAVEDAGKSVTESLKKTLPAKK